MGADERAQHVWAHDGNVQSYHWRFMTSVGRKNVAGFFQLPSLMLVTTTPFSTISFWSFLRCFCIFKQQTFELYDDPEMRPMCNQSGQMFAPDGDFGIFRSSGNGGHNQPAENLCSLRSPIGVRSAM